ncbi:S-layer homology domain-containing protein [Paenibacillaceae bacterium T2]|uniref:S-layer homology domain-containing protein n=2 Tax=Ferviditalea candida TaxID=3108399 RepID=A0ABU5ZMZ3_9BACL|nr:S-layer homology domain-containing protein [Paenibacillaceae bacterium T2]
MKKSLSLLLAIAMVFSMFASVAFAADSTMTAQEKFDALKAKGIFTGYPDGTSGLDKEMTRAEFAVVIAKLFNLDTTNAPSTASFTDVPQTHWANKYVEAAVKAGMISGYGNGTFGPKNNVKIEEMARILVDGLGIKVDDQATVEGTVDSWAVKYVAAAIKAGLIPSASDYTKNASRAELVGSSYVAYEAQQVPAKVSVTKAEATGVHTVAVYFDKAVDSSVATLSLKKGSIAVATTVSFAEDKKSAILTLTDVKVSEGTYTVTLGGIAADQIGTASANFTAENEKVTKIEFLSANDTIAQAAKVIVKLKAYNQYGEAASASAGSYTVYAGNANNAFVKLTKSDSGELLLTLNTTDPNYTPGISIIPVNIYNNDTRASVSKNFKLGTAPFISKMELGPVKYSNGDSISGTGENATFDVKNYDQYGNVVPYSPADDTNIRVIFNAYLPALNVAVGDSNNDDVADVKLSLNSNVDKSDVYNFTVYNQAGTSTGSVKIGAGKVATKVELGDMNDVIAAGDTEAYIPLVAYDANGNQLSADDIVKTQNTDRISVSSSTGAGNAVIVTAGTHKGQIKVTNIPATPKSIIAVTAVIAQPNASSTANRTYTVSDVRIPESIGIVTEPAQKIVADGSSKFEMVLKDQYGKKLKTIRNVDAAGNFTTSTDVGIDQYRVSVTQDTYDGSIYLNYTPFVAQSGQTVTTFSGDVDATFNQEYQFVTATGTATGFAKITAVIEKTKDAGQTWTEVSSKITRKIEAISSSDKLTYSIADVGNVYAAIDDKALASTQQVATASNELAKEVKVTAIDAAGNTVALPGSVVSITSSNVGVAQVNVDPSTNKAYVVGNKAGTATLNVAFKNNKGETIVSTVPVTTKTDIPVAASFVANNDSRTAAQAKATTDAFVLMDLELHDNYGIKYTDDGIKDNNNLFGVVFSVKNVVGGTVTVDNNGNLTISAGVTSFELTATTANGMSASTAVAN